MRAQVEMADLLYEKKLGEGQFGKVFLVSDRSNGAQYALKCIKKKEVVELGMEEFVVTEKQVLEQMNHPFIVRF